MVAAGIQAEAAAEPTAGHSPGFGFQCRTGARREAGAFSLALLPASVVQRFARDASKHPLIRCVVRHNLKNHLLKRRALPPNRMELKRFLETSKSDSILWLLNCSPCSLRLTFPHCRIAVCKNGVSEHEAGKDRSRFLELDPGQRLGLWRKRRLSRKSASQIPNSKRPRLRGRFFLRVADLMLAVLQSRIHAG